MEVLDVLAQDSCSPGGIEALGHPHAPLSVSPCPLPPASLYVFPQLHNCCVLQKLNLPVQEPGK